MCWNGIPSTTLLIEFISHPNTYVSFPGSSLHARYRQAKSNLSRPLGSPQPLTTAETLSGELTPHSHKREGKLEPKLEPGSDQIQSRDLKCCPTRLPACLKPRLPCSSWSGRGGSGRWGAVGWVEVPSSDAPCPLSSTRSVYFMGKNTLSS